MRKNIKKITTSIMLSMVLTFGVAQPIFVEARAVQVATANKTEQDATSAATQLTHKDAENVDNGKKTETAKKGTKEKAKSEKGSSNKSEIKKQIKEVEDKIARVKKNSKIPEFGKKKALKELRKQLKELKAQLKQK